MQYLPYNFLYIQLKTVLTENLFINLCFTYLGSIKSTASIFIPLLKPCLGMS